MSMSQALLAEFSHEAAATRKLLARVPEGKLGWQPHDKSMTLARLTGHIAEIPQWAGVVVGQEELVLDPSGYTPFLPETTAQLLAAHDQNVAAFRETLEGVSDDQLFVTWRMRKDDQVITEMPRVAALRAFILSHIVHHRGQLSVYLRLLDVALPQIYGPTADEPTF